MMQGSLATRLRVLRARKGLNLTDAAHRIGVTRHTLASLEKGGQEPHFDTLAKLAEGYGVPVEDLLVGSESGAKSGVGSEADPELRAAAEQAPRAGRLVDLSQVREWLSAQDAVFVAMSEAEFVDVVAQIESLEELQELYGEILKERGRIEKVLEKPDLGKELFPAIGIRSLPTKREREGEAMRPSRNAWQLRREIGHIYRRFEGAIEDYSMYLFNEGKTEDFLIHPRRIATMPESTRRTLADVRRETFREVLAGVGA